jgi:hypothetical protein
MYLSWAANSFAGQDGKRYCNGGDGDAHRGLSPKSATILVDAFGGIARVHGAAVPRYRAATYSISREFSHQISGGLDTVGRRFAISLCQPQPAPPGSGPGAADRAHANLDRRARSRRPAGRPASRLHVRSGPVGWSRKQVANRSTVAPSRSPPAAT